MKKLFFTVFMGAVLCQGLQAMDDSSDYLGLQAMDDSSDSESEHEQPTLTSRDLKGDVQHVIDIIDRVHDKVRKGILISEALEDYTRWSSDEKIEKFDFLMQHYKTSDIVLDQEICKDLLYDMMSYSFKVKKDELLKQKFLEWVEWCCAHKAPVNNRKKYTRKTPLIESLDCSFPEVTEILLKYGADSTIAVTVIDLIDAKLQSTYENTDANRRVKQLVENDIRARQSQQVPPQRSQSGNQPNSTAEDNIIQTRFASIPLKAVGISCAVTVVLCIGLNKLYTWWSQKQENDEEMDSEEIDETQETSVVSSV